MHKVIIKRIKSIDEYGETHSTAVTVDGNFVGGGFYGGEPEDNSMYRTYKWVEPLLVALSKALGAKIEESLVDNWTNDDDS